MGNVERSPFFDNKVKTSERNFWIEEDAGFFYYFSKKTDSNLHIEIFGGGHQNIFKLKIFDEKKKKRDDENDDEEEEEEENNDENDLDYIEEIDNTTFNDSQKKSKRKRRKL